MKKKFSLSSYKEASINSALTVLIGLSGLLGVTTCDADVEKTSVINVVGSTEVVSA